MPSSILSGTRRALRTAAVAAASLALLAPALPAYAVEAPPAAESPSAAPEPADTAPGALPGTSGAPAPEETSVPEETAAGEPAPEETSAGGTAPGDPDPGQTGSGQDASAPAEQAPGTAAPSSSDEAPAPEPSATVPPAPKPEEPAYVTAGRKAIEAKAKSLKLVSAGGLRCSLPQKGCTRKYKPSPGSSKRVSIYWTAATRARAVNLSHATGKKYWAATTVYGKLGYPTSDLKAGLEGNAAVQYFQKGRIAYSPATGAQILTGQILAEWLDRGGRTGKLGYPLQPAKTRDARTTQVFQGGSLVARRSGAYYFPKDECWALGAGKTRYKHGYAANVSFAIAEAYGTYRAAFINCRRAGAVYVQSWETSTATVGLRGFKKPGVPSGHTSNRWSPQGSYTVTEAFGEGNPGTALSYRTLNSRSRWSGTPGSSYNKYYEAPSPFFERWPDENLWNIMLHGDYRQSVVINYNRGPGQQIRQGEGFAIFLHAHPVATYGCIALELKNVTKYLTTARKGDRIIMGVRKDIFTA